MPKLLKATASVIAVFIILPFCAFSCGERHPENLESPAMTVASAPLDVGISLPLELEVRLIDHSAPSDVARIRVSFSSKLQDANIAIALKLPEGALIEQGPTSWQGELQLGKTAGFECTIRQFDSKPGFIVAKATVTAPGGTSFSQAASAYFDPQLRDKNSTGTEQVKGYDGAQQLQIHRRKVSSGN